MNLQPTLALGEETARQLTPRSLSQPALGEAVLAKGYYHYACQKDYDTAVRSLTGTFASANNSRILHSLADVERTRGQWDRSDAYSTKLSGSTRATFYYSPARSFPDRCSSLPRSAAKT